MYYCGVCCWLNAESYVNMALAVLFDSVDNVYIDLVDCGNIFINQGYLRF